MHRFIISLFITLLLLPGCSLLQPTNPYTPVLAKGRPPALAPPASRVHMAIKPELSDEPFTLNRCITIALANNPEVGAIGVALLLMPCLYLAFTRTVKGEPSRAALEAVSQELVAPRAGIESVT